MKKILCGLLFAATLCLSLCTLIACESGKDPQDGPEDPSGQPKITLSEETLDLTVGETYELSAEYDGEGTPAWASSRRNESRLPISRRWNRP